ncbi:MAG TPA: hypothetical protein VM223_04565 [Planctomycetota bacterium]|nr:hypothetical protein [Planctomycetota bacterium]
MPAYDDTSAYPAFSGATAKRDLLRYVLARIQPNCPNFQDVMYRLNNTDMSALTDGATVYNPAGTFAA